MAEDGKHAGGRFLTEPEKAYIAGIIDGEGCIFLGKNRNKSNPYSEFNYCSEIAVEMGCEAVPRWLYEKLGGAISSRVRYEREYAMWEWRASGERGENIIGQIYPYLVEKQREADVYLLFRESVRKKHNNRRIKLTKEETAYRDSLILRLRRTRKTYAEAV